MQHASRRILEGLSPLYLEELGIEKSIQTLLQNAHSSAADRYHVLPDRSPAGLSRSSAVANNLPRRTGSGDERHKTCAGNDVECRCYDARSSRDDRGFRRWNWVSGQRPAWQRVDRNVRPQPRAGWKAGLAARGRQNDCTLLAACEPAVPVELKRTRCSAARSNVRGFTTSPEGAANRRSHPCAVQQPKIQSRSIPPCSPGLRLPLPWKRSP